MSWFVISLEYVKPLADVDAAMKAHVAFLERHQAKGTFIAWGRKVPRTGGIILAQGDDRAAIEKAMTEDPFVTKKLAKVEITEFSPKPPAVVAAFEQFLV
ncbi:MAG TPA: YciI family protein [Polyangiaceae bacterium]